MASTRNYSPGAEQGVDPNQPYTSPYASSGAWGDQVPDTTRFYKPPVAQNYQPAPEKKSNVLKWTLIATLAIFLIIGGSIALFAGFFFSSSRRSISTEVGAAIEEQIREKVRQAEEQAREAEQRAREAAELAKESAESGIPPIPPVPPPPGAGVPLGMEKLKYPRANVINSSTVLGSEFVKMTTKDDFKTVRDFYQKTMGAPIVQNNEADGESAIFKSAGSPTVFIIVSRDEDNAGQVQIILSKLQGFSIPGR